MQSDIQEIYRQNIRPLPDSEQLRLATLILEKITKKGGKGKTNRNGKKREIFGMWNGKGLTKEEYLKLDHNDRIDFDLGRAYSDNHEDED